MAQNVYWGRVGKNTNVSTQFVRIHKDYGKKTYYERSDVKAIRSLVFDVLDQLEKKEKISNKIRNKKIFAKPSLVSPFADDLFEQSPATTDPRVFDSVLEWIKKHEPQEIIVGETPCIGYNSRFVFKHIGYDKICGKHGAKKSYLDEENLIEVYLPKAGYGKHLLLPQSFLEVVENGGTYVSVPKLKNNVFCGVTFSVKNNMGLLQGKTRLAGHDQNLGQKLVDMLWIAKPGLIIVDGVIAGDGQGCTLPKIHPAGLVLAGVDEIAVDSVACRAMRVHLKDIEMLSLAKKSGFGNWTHVELYDRRGKKTGIREIEKDIGGVEKADHRTQSKQLSQKFPNIRVYAGYPGKGKNSQDYDKGGNTAMIRHALFDYFSEEKLEKVQLDVVYGPGDKNASGETVYFDSRGKPHTIEELEENLGENTIVVGSGNLKNKARVVVNEHPARPILLHLAMHKATKTRCRVVVHPGETLLHHLLHDYTRAYYLSALRHKTVRTKKTLLGATLDKHDKHGKKKPKAKNKNYVVLGNQKPRFRERLRLVKEDWKDLFDYVKTMYL